MIAGNRFVYMYRTLKFYGAQIMILHDHQLRVENELFTLLFLKEFHELLCVKQRH